MRKEIAELVARAIGRGKAWAKKSPVNGSSTTVKKKKKMMTDVQVFY